MRTIHTVLLTKTISFSLHDEIKYIVCFKRMIPSVQTQEAIENVLTIVSNVVKLQVQHPQTHKRFSITAVD